MLMEVTIQFPTFKWNTISCYLSHFISPYLFLAIHRAAGPQLRAACYDVPEVKPGVRCPTGEARITPYVLSLDKLHIYCALFALVL